MARWKEAVCEQCATSFAHYQSRPQRFCSLRCSALHMNQTSPRERLSSREVFELRVRPRLMAHASGCLLWTGAKNSQGYGQTTVDGKRAYIHRLAWEYQNGDLEPGEYVLHRCDTPLCARYEHLFVGTHKDNMRDAQEKGRMARGQRAAASKLTDNQVLEIRSQWSRGAPQRELAATFGVSRTAIWHIVHRNTWRHI